DAQRYLIAILARQLFAERTDRVGEIVRFYRRGAQSLHRVAAFRDRLGCLVDRTGEDLLRLRRAAWQQVERSLEPQQQPLEALQQRVVQFARDPRAFVDARVERRVEVSRDLPHAQAVQRD